MDVVALFSAGLTGAILTVANPLRAVAYTFDVDELVAYRYEGDKMKGILEWVEEMKNKYANTVRIYWV